MSAKKWLQIVGGSLMLAAVVGAGDIRWRFHPKMFLAGALIFLSTFLTWKRDRNDDNSSAGSSL
jgi:hypothetical protein